MKLIVLLFVGLGVLGVVGWLLQHELQQYDSASITSNSSPAQVPQCEPTFRDGGGPYYQPNAPFRGKLTSDTAGQPLVVSGKVLASDCVTPLTDVILDVWQANESGNYEAEWYRGRVRVSDDGSYRFETAIPKGYGEGTGYRPPHIHFKVWRGPTELVTSQMFLPAAREQQISEAYIIDLTETDTGWVGEHNIIVPAQ